MKRKCEVIVATPQLQDLLQPLDAPTDSGPVLLRSRQYVAVGCDLANTRNLDSILQDEFEMSKCIMLCIAEVSVTYMDVEAANSLIAWASKYDNSMSHLLFKA